MVERYQRKEGIVTRRIAGETILVPVTNNLADMLRIFALDPVGEHIWSQLGSPCDIETLARGVIAAFEEAEPQVREDCREFVDDLLTAGLIVAA